MQTIDQKHGLIKPIILFFVLVLIFATYLFIAGKSEAHLKRADKFGNIPEYGRDQYYNLQTSAFLSGHLYLPVKPRKELLELKDPYDPEKNAPYRLLDLSLFKDKYYMYFGVTPVLVLYLPLKLLGIEVYDKWATAIFSFGGFLWTVLLIFHLCKVYFPKTKFWKKILAVLVLFSVIPISGILINPVVYQVAISAGYFFLMGSIYFLCKLLKRDSLLFCFLSSLFFGLSVGCRAHFILGTIIFPLIWFWVLQKNKNKTYLKKAVVLFFFPLLAILFLFFLYNYLRFGNPLDLGDTYQLAYFNWQDEDKGFGTKFIIPGIYYFFFHKLFFSPIIPFSSPFTFVPNWLKVTNDYFIDKPVGVFPGLPFTLILLFATFYFPVKKLILKHKTSFKNNKYPIAEFFIILSFSILNLLTILSHQGALNRYLPDYAGSFVICSFILWMYFENEYKNGKITLLFSLFSVLSILNGLSVIFYKYFYDLYFSNASLYTEILRTYSLFWDVIMAVSFIQDLIWKILLGL